jgi:hypothetical protein
VIQSVIAALNSWEKREFSYGDSDCCKFAAHILTQVTGRDYIARFDYANEAEAAKLIAHHGDLAGLVTYALDVQPSLDYSDGDPVVVRLPIVGDAMGVTLGAVAVCLTRKGLTRIHQRYIVRGWKICR